MTIPEIFNLEPRLKQLEDDIQAVDSDVPNFCANHLWYRTLDGPNFKARMGQLVGWFSDNPALQSHDTYSTVYHYLYKQLPHCKDCGCW
ncbi:hypothetical protein [Desulfopila sp. IMCC35008]|uniref:hypothetical protein n=1 Tax=Desulfopila sp. IMCC35008 TaxID=2653858 RepID=UPI0013D5971F|nr:hypothetical protein [Desulfopila sp. IMCC35008]